MGSRDKAEEQLPGLPGQAARRRRGPSGSVLALQRMAGNQAVTQLMRRTPAQPKKGFDDPSFHDAPDGVTVGANALPAGTTTADAGTVQVKDGHVGAAGAGVDRVLLDNLSGTQGDGWDDNQADKDHVGAVTPGAKKGKRGRAIALVPHGMPAKGPIAVIVHLHGIDVGGLTGTSGMRETGGRPEDVGDFQIPQQLEAFTKKHAGARVAVLMPLGATVGSKGKYSDFGIHDFDKFIDECLGELGLESDAATVYLSAHSGGGFTISGLAGDPNWKLKTHKLGGVFGFESFHGADIENWQKMITGHLTSDLTALKKLPSGSAQQLRYLRDDGFRFAAFGGSKYYTANLTTLRKTVLKWFSDNKAALKAATAGNADVVNMLWRNYQVVFDDAQHMEALSKNSHFESMLESIADRGPAPIVNASTPPPPVAKTASATPPVKVHTPPVSTAPSAPETKHVSEPKTNSKSKSKPKVALNADQLRRGAIDQATLTDAERELIGARDAADANLTAVKKKLGDIDKQRKHHDITATEAKEAKTPLLGEQAAAQKALKAAAAKVKKNAKAKADMEKALVKAFPQFAKDPRKAVEAWFGNIVPDASFLGHPVAAEGSVSPGVHKELLERLRMAEKDLEAKGKTPVIHSIGGLRPPSPATGGTLPSYHCFGLAVDIDAGSNPFVRWDTQPVVKRATLLVRGSEYDVLGMPDNDVATQWGHMKMASEALRDYFALRGDGAEAKIEAQLASHPGARARGDAAHWKKAIEDDLAHLRTTGTWQSGDPTKTMMSIDKDLVLALTKAGLTWGGMYQRAGAGRDLMHFDWRGGTINQ